MESLAQTGGHPDGRWDKRGHRGGAARIIVAAAWGVLILDFVFSDTRGTRPADFETTLKFVVALIRLAAEDPVVHKLTAEV
jgi:hypothetical protein